MGHRSPSISVESHNRASNFRHDCLMIVAGFPYDNSFIRRNILYNAGQGLAMAIPKADSCFLLRTGHSSGNF
jgi:hypothetical protein